jgi:hypothetical protein
MTSIFGGGSNINVNATGTLVPQSFVPTDGQTVFNITAFTYTQNTSSLLVFLNGSKQISGVDFTETSTSSFTFLEPVSSEDKVEIIGFPLAIITQLDGTAIYANLASSPGSSLIGFVQSGADAVATTVQAKLRESVSVKDFGAVGDGATDDTAAIQLAIDHAATYGYELLFPGGTYIVNPIVNSSVYPAGTYAFSMRSNMYIVGSGKATLKIKDNSSTDALPKFFTMFYSTSALSNISIENIVFDGNAANNPISPSRGSLSFNRYNQAFIGFWGASATGSNVQIQNCIFKNNPGMNNIIMQVTPTGAALGSGWLINNTQHIDGGLDTDDFTAIFGYADDVTVTNNLFTQTTSPTVYNGVGARNAYEVHGSRQEFSGNLVKNYFGGVIVNSNFQTAVDQVLVTNNIFSNMYLYGVRLWRQATQTAISNVTISNNVIGLSSTLYSAASVYKSGIIGASNFDLSITDVVISNNRVTQAASATNVSAGVYLLGQTTAAQRHDRISIKNNEILGTYSGILVQAAGGGVGASFGSIVISGNNVRNLRNVGANVNPIGIYCRGTGGLAISDLEVRDNLVEDDIGGALETKFGLWVQETITRLALMGNRFVSVTTPYTESSLTVTTREGDDLRQTYPSGTGITVSGWSLTTRKTIKVTATYAAFSAAALFKDLTLITLPARTRLIGIIADTTTPYSGAGVLSATMRSGPSAGSATFLVDADVFTAATTKGLVDADMGTVLNRAGAVNGGNIQSWTGNNNIIVRLTTTGANTDQLSAGVTTFYITVETFL